MQSTDPPEFPSYFDQRLQLDGGMNAHFGRDVLSGLVDGLRVEREQHLGRRSRWNWGTGVLGCAMWMDDPELLGVLRECESACVVVTKQGRSKRADEKLAPIKEFTSGAQGLSQHAFPELAELAPAEQGRPLMVGPFEPPLDADITAVRQLGFRKVDNHLVPIVHAKLLLVGEMRWTDEHPTGHVVDDIWFVPTKLWIGSANFTAASRRSLEMGLWTTETSLLKAARSFLLELVAQLRTAWEFL